MSHLIVYMWPGISKYHLHFIINSRSSFAFNGCLFNSVSWKEALTGSILSWLYWSFLSNGQKKSLQAAMPAATRMSQMLAGLLSSICWHFKCVLCLPGPVPWLSVPSESNILQFFPEINVYDLSTLSRILMLFRMQTIFELFRYLRILRTGNNF